MNRSSVNCAWWHSPTQTAEAIAPLDAVKVTVKCLEDGERVPDAAARVVATALRKYLDGQSDITGNLGLRPRRGGRHETPLAIERNEQRNTVIKNLVDLQDGPKTERCKRVAELLKAPPMESRVTESDVMGYVIKLHQEFGGGLPTSMRQILRIVDGK